MKTEKIDYTRIDLRPVSNTEFFYGNIYPLFGEQFLIGNSFPEFVALVDKMFILSNEQWKIVSSNWAFKETLVGVEKETLLKKKYLKL